MEDTKMTNTIRVDTQYTMGYETEIDLPEGKTWEDVKSWYIKYHSLSVVFNDETGNGYCEPCVYWLADNGNEEAIYIKKMLEQEASQ